MRRRRPAVPVAAPASLPLVDDDGSPLSPIEIPPGLDVRSEDEALPALSTVAAAARAYAEDVEPSPGVRRDRLAGIAYGALVGSGSEALRLAASPRRRISARLAEARAVAVAEHHDDLDDLDPF